MAGSQVDSTAVASLLAPRSPPRKHESIIRSAFDPLALNAGANAAAPPPEAPKFSGKIYVAGSTEHAAVGIDPPQAHGAVRTPHLLTTLVDAQVVQASCGWHHSALVLSSGEMYSFGDNKHGQLGQGDVARRLTPALVPGLSTLRVSQVSCGRSHTAFVCSEGDLFTFGLGLYGQLGHGTLTDEPSPRRVTGVGGPAASVSCGDLHTILLRGDGRALSCGFNDAGRLGRQLDGGSGGDGADSAACAEVFGPLVLSAAVASASDAFAVVAVAAGGAHSAIVTADGSVYTCGRGASGQLGHGSTEDELMPRRVGTLQPHRIRRAALGASHSLFLSHGGVPFACGCGGYGRLGLGHRANVLSPQPIVALEEAVVVQISAGGAHSSLTTETGQIFLCGDDGAGQLGVHSGRQSALLPTQPPKFVAATDGAAPVVLGASCGGAHTAFLLRAVVDAAADYREDQVAVAASVIEALFRGNHVRTLSDAIASRKRGGRADVSHSMAQREAAVTVLQAQWRLHLAARERERRARLREMRALRAQDAGDGALPWNRVQQQFDTAVTAKRLAQAGATAASNMTRASW